MQAKTTETSPQTANDWYLAAITIEINNQDDARKKIECYQHVLDQDPNNISALGSISWIYYSHMKDVSNAKEYLERVLTLQPRNTYFLDKKSLYLETSGNKEDALALQDEIISIASDGKPFSDDAGGEEADNKCRQLNVLTQAWGAKGRLAYDLKQYTVGNECYEMSNKYGEEWGTCIDKMYES